MTINSDVVIQQGNSYFGRLKTNEILTDMLEEYISEHKIITKPGNPKKEQGYAYAGGLIKLALDVTTKMVHLNNLYKKENQLPLKSIVKVGLLYQIGKCEMYIPETSEWHKTNLGRMYNYNPDITSMTIGERSVLILLRCGVPLTDQEYVAILNHNKLDDNASEYHNSQIGDLLKSAIKLVLSEEKLK